LSPLKSQAVPFPPAAPSSAVFCGLAWQYIISGAESPLFQAWERRFGRVPILGTVPDEGREGVREIVGGVDGRGAQNGGAAPGRRAQGEVHFEADLVLDAQNPEDVGRGQREVRELEGGPDLEPDIGRLARQVLGWG